MLMGRQLHGVPGTREREMVTIRSPSNRHHVLLLESTYLYCCKGLVEVTGPLFSVHSLSLDPYICNVVGVKHRKQK